MSEITVPYSFTFKYSLLSMNVRCIAVHVVCKTNCTTIHHTTINNFQQYSFNHKACLAFYKKPAGHPLQSISINFQIIMKFIQVE